MKIIFRTQSRTRSFIEQRKKAQTFILNTDNISGLGLYGDTMRVYKAGKTLYIDFATVEEASRAMEEITEAMTKGEPFVTASCEPLNIDTE